MPLCIMAEVRQRLGRRRERPLDAERGHLELLRLHAGQDEGDCAASVRAGHRRSVHQLKVQNTEQLCKQRDQIISSITDKPR